jgi:two-component system, LytTR family, response regulator
MISCIIIDDQLEAINVLKIHINAKDNLDLKATFTSPVEALNFLEKNELDLVFVDIEMPIINGLELIETIQAKRGIKIPKFILTTGYDAYALKSYQFGVIDYLMKPVTFKNIVAAVDKYIAILGNTLKPQASDIQYFFVEHEGKKVKIEPSEIVYIESAGNYISIFCNDKRVVLYKTLNEIEDKLNSPAFIRIHKSFIVSIGLIKAITQTELDVMYQGKVINLPVGRTYREQLKQKLHLD